MWIISIAAWGAHRAKFREIAWPSICAAIQQSNEQFKLILHTDDPSDFRITECEVQFRPVNILSCMYTTYGNCNREAIEMAPEGSFIALLTSDIIVSREFFLASERRFHAGKRAIVGSAARTMPIAPVTAVGLPARKLLDWSFDPVRLHPVTAGCVWGKGHNLVAWLTYFPGPHGVVARAFHLHPFALVNDRHLWFDRETVDLDLLERYSHDEIYVVVSPDEMSFAEVSGLEKNVAQLAEPISINSILSWACRYTSPMQRWLFANHRIVVQGTGEDNLDVEICEDISRILG